MSELKPCPFCGGDMQPRNALWPSDGDVDAIIHVGPSYCPLQVFSLDTADEGISVAEAWNTRTLEPQSSDDVELFRGLAKFLYEQMTPGQLLKVGRYIGDDELKALYEARSRSEQDAG